MHRCSSFVKQADTPLKRLGLLLLAASCFFWFGMAIHWNIAKHGFIYSYWDTWTEEAPKPLDNDEITWLRGAAILDNFDPGNGIYFDNRKRRDGWVSYDISCLKNHRAMDLSDLYPIACRNDFIPDEINNKRIHAQSFTAFVDNLFSTYSGGHLRLSMFFVFLTALSLMMFKGMFDKALLYITTGKMGRK